jgi:hypothetical protein
VTHVRLERFLERAQIEFVRPRRTVLAMKQPEGIGDGVDIEQSVEALLIDMLWSGRRHRVISVDGELGSKGTGQDARGSGP